jgi:hypothetical protein
MNRDQQMPIKTARFDAAEHLGSDEAIDPNSAVFSSPEIHSVA